MRWCRLRRSGLCGERTVWRASKASGLPFIDGEVIQAAATSHELALQLHDMDHRRRARVVVEYVRPASDAYIVGVG